jgi:hypothetical protein
MARGGQNITVRACFAIGLAVCIYAVARAGMGAWYFEEKSPAGLQTALHWDPYNAKYYDALATLRHFYADNENPYEQVKLYEHATRLSPRHAQYWADLGTAYDWAGNRHDALRALERARDLFPNSPDIHWRLANFYVRTGKTHESLTTLRKVLLGVGVPPQDVFALGESVTPDKKTILDEMVPPRAPILLGYLNFQAAAGDMPAAAQTWGRLLELKLPFELAASFPYLDTLIQKRETQELARTWSALGERFPEKVGKPTAANLVTNGSFESNILNGGLDWRVVPVDGATVTIDSQQKFEGRRSVRIEFDGTRNVDYGHLFQYMLVQPNTKYRFSGYMRTQGITTDSGPRFQVLDPYGPEKEFNETKNLVGTSGWMEQELAFKTLPDARLLMVRIIRPASKKFDNKIAGTVWIDDLRLTVQK